MTDHPGPTTTTAAAAATAAADASMSMYPLDESPAKAPPPSVAFAATDELAQVLCTPEDGRKATSNHRNYNPRTNPVADTVGSALNNHGNSNRNGNSNGNKVGARAGAGAGAGPAKAAAAAPALALADTASTTAPTTTASTVVVAAAAAASSEQHPEQPQQQPPAAASTSATAADPTPTATPESSPKANRRLFQAMQAGTDLPPSLDTSVASDLDGNGRDEAGEVKSENNGEDAAAVDGGGGFGQCADAATPSPVSAAAAAAAAAAQIRRDVVARQVEQKQEQEEASAAAAAATATTATSTAPTGAAPPSATPPKGTAAGTRTSTSTSTSIPLHHPADESPVKALFRGGKPFQSSSLVASSSTTSASNPNNSASATTPRASPAKQHFASTAIPSPPAVAAADDNNNTRDRNSGGGSNNGGHGSSANAIALLDASILADQSFLSQGANTVIDDEAAAAADEDHDDYNNKDDQDASVEMDAFDLAAGISPIFVRGLCSAGADFGGCGGAGSSSSSRKQQQQQQQQQTQTMKTKAPTDDTSSNTIANLREEIDCLRAKVKARDVAIVGLRGEVSEAKADLKHVRLVLQKEQRRNGGDIGSGGTGSSASAGDTTNNNSEGANGSTALSGHSEWISSYSYSATTATSADVETTAPTASTAAADVAMYQRQIQRQQEEIRSRDVRLNWMQRKMESLEVERGSLLEQVAEAVPATSGTLSTVPAGGENAARCDDEEDLLNRSESSQPGRIATASSKMDEAVALRLKLHKSDSTVAALKAEINTIRSPELYASSQAAELERLVQKTKRDAAAIAALKSENSRLVMEAAGGKSVRDEDTDQVVAHGGANKPIDEILGEVSRCVDPGEIYGDGPEDEFFGDSLVEDPTIRSMSTPPADKVKIKALEKKLCEAKELEFSMRSRLGVLTAALNGESSKVSAEKVISEQKEVEFEGNLDQLAAANDEQVALIARMEQDIDDREKSLEVLRAIIDSQKKEIKMQRGNAERWKEGERALEEENKKLKRTLKKAAKVVKNAASNSDQADLDATTDVTMETEASPNVSQEGVEIMEDAFSRVAFSVTKAQDTISQWMEKLPQCVPDDAASFVTK